MKTYKTNSFRRDSRLPAETWMNSQAQEGYVLASITPLVADRRDAGYINVAHIYVVMVKD